MNNSTIKHYTTKLITSFHSQSAVYSNDLNISCCQKIAQIDKNHLIIDLAFDQNLGIFAMCTKAKQFISANSPSCTEQNGTNNFVIACTVVEILLCSVRPLKVGFCDFNVI